MIRTLIFDWDGTLHDTKSLYGKAFRKAYSYLVEKNLAPERFYSDEETSIYLGMSAPAMWESFMPELSSEEKRKAGSIIGGEMDRLVLAGQAVLYPDAENVLTRLKQAGYHMVILSNCRHAYMENHRQKFRLDRWFEAYYAAEDYDFRPKEEVFPEIQKQYPGEYVVIGDRDSDLQTAKVHHLLSVGCLYGFGQKGELEGATLTIAKLKDLPQRIATLCG